LTAVVVGKRPIMWHDETTVSDVHYARGTFGFVR